MGAYHVCGLTTFGDIKCWGSDAYDLNLAPSGTYSKIISGHDYSCALETTGVVKCWGNIAQTPTDGNFIDIEAGQKSACGILDSNFVICWGAEEHGQLTIP